MYIILLIISLVLINSRLPRQYYKYNWLKEFTSQKTCLGIRLTINKLQKYSGHHQFLPSLSEAQTFRLLELKNSSNELPLFKWPLCWQKNELSCRMIENVFRNKWWTHLIKKCSKWKLVVLQHIKGGFDRIGTKI